MTLADAIQFAGLTGTAAEIRTALGQIVDLPQCTDLWSYNGVARRYGTQLAEGFGAAIKAAGLEVAYIRYATTGFDLSESETQGQLDQLAAINHRFADLCNSLKEIGRPKQPRWQQYGLNALPSEADITAAITEIARVAELRAMIATINTAIVDGTSVDAVRQQIAGG